MVAWTVEAELQLLLLALKQAPKFVIDPDQIIAEWAGADKPTIRSVRDRFNMLRRKSGGNNINVANCVASTPASATTPAPGTGSAKHKTPTASSIVTPSKNGLSDALGASKTNGYTASGTGVATKDTIVIDDITFPLTPTPTTETKKSRRRSYNRRPPGSSTAFIDMNPAHFPGPPGSSPAPVGEAAIKSETQESKAANMSEGVNGVLAATPGSIGEGSAVKAGISTPSKSKLKLKENANGESIGNGKINGKTNARNTAATNSITNSNSNSNAKSIAKPNSITNSGSGSGSGSGNKKRKASHLFPSSSSSDEDGPGAISSDADSDSVSEFESESKSDTSRDEISGDEIVTPSKSMFHINSSARTNNSGKGNCKSYGKGNEYTTTTTPTNSTVTATTRKPLPRRSKSSTPADAYTIGGDHVNTGGDADEKLGVLGDMNGVKDGVGVGGVAGLGVADVDGIGSGVGGDMSDDEMDLDFDIDADVDFDVNADDEMDFNIDVDEKEWFGEMDSDAKGKGVGKAIGNGKGKVGNVHGNGGGKGKGKRGWRERVSKFQV